MLMSPVAGLNILPTWSWVQEAGQVDETCRNDVPLVETEAAAQRVGTGLARRAALTIHL